MKRVLVLIGILAVVGWLASCSEEPREVTSPDSETTITQIGERQPSPEVAPEATVPILTYPPREQLLTGGDEASLEPAELFATLKPGECIEEHKILHLPEMVAPAQGDIMFSFDLTGSMRQEVQNVKNNSVNIMNALRAIIPDTKFGCESHMDYTEQYTYCGYSAIYGYAPDGDYPYNLDGGLTDDVTAVANVISGLWEFGNGFDWPEDYSRVFYETYANPGIGWRDGSKKLLLAWLDAYPHDCDVWACIGGSGSTGPDPGRDEIAGNADDLEILDVLDGMAAEDITLLVLYSGIGDFNLWECFASRTGGRAFQIGTDGEIPGGLDIAEFIADSLVLPEIMHIDTLTLEVCTPGYEDWLVSVVPAYYTDIDLDEPQDFHFDIEICVPEGTEDGEHCFEICAVGDGVVYATQMVCIMVESEIEVPLDIKPTSCPNPLNVKSNGLLPAAVLGTMDFDVMQIDPETVMLEGVAPIRSNYEDVATPFEPYVGKEDCFDDCHEEGPDGYMDFTLKFRVQDIVEAIGMVEDRECIVLTLTGQLFDGTEIIGEDVVLILKKYPADRGD
jgi:hypothetical protein